MNRIHHKCRSHAPEIEVWEGFTGRWFYRVCDPANALGNGVDAPKASGYDNEPEANQAALKALTLAKERRHTRFEVHR